MAFESSKITDEDINENGVASAADTLQGTPSENKAVFDKFLRNVLMKKFNAFIDELSEEMIMAASRVPTLLSQLENDIGYAEKSEIPTQLSGLENDIGYAEKSEIPTQLSELANDEGFVSETVIDEKIAAAKPNYGALKIYGDETSGTIETGDVYQELNIGAYILNLAGYGATFAFTEPIAGIRVYAPKKDDDAANKEYVDETIESKGYITAEDIPENVSEFTNDVGYITSSDVPKNVSSFANDAKYISNYSDEEVYFNKTLHVSNIYGHDQMNLGADQIQIAAIDGLGIDFGGYGGNPYGKVTGDMRVPEPVSAESVVPKSYVDSRYTSMTRAEYDALDEKDAETFYFVEEDA